MNFLLAICFSLLTVITFGQQDSLTLENAKGKQVEYALPVYGQIKLKSGDKLKGMLHQVDNSTVMIKTKTDDDGTIREAKKNKLLSERERSDMLYIHPKSYTKADVEAIVIRRPTSDKAENVKKVGLYAMLGLTATAMVFATLNDIKFNQTPYVAIAGTVLLALIFFLLKKAGTKKYSFYKWKIK